MDPSLSSRSSRRKRPQYDVFISYSFEDIGNGFISHLKRALDLNGFRISDHTTLPRGEDKKSELLKAIEESEIYLIVFSSDYASSTRCLDELVDVMDCFHKLDQRKILPVFFKVEPSNVKNQGCSTTNVAPNRVQKLKQALTDVCKLAGLPFQFGDEAKFKLEIVEDLMKMKRPEELHVTDYPVGVGSRAKELISTLRLDLKDHVLVVAVSGITGIGKTTIVKEVFNRIAPSFDQSVFLADIHYMCQVPSWKAELPKTLISCLTRGNKNADTSNHNDAVTSIITLVSRQKTLLVLDGVDKFQQLELLGIFPKWFHEGSRIIVITRDKGSLGAIPHASYHTRLLNRRESLNLFTRHMFASDDPVNPKFLEEVVGPAGGIPFVIKVWSGHFKQHDREEWPNILETLKAIPHGDFFEQLLLSFNSLSDNSKMLLLDIIFFINRMEKDLVVKVFEDKDLLIFPNTEIRCLVNRFLVEITSDSKLKIPRAIEELGHEIVRQQNKDEPGRRTRLADPKIVMRVLTECSGTELVESITYLEGAYTNHEKVTLEALTKMSNLRLINFASSIFSNDEVTRLSFGKLKLMCWRRSLFKSLDNIDMENVVVLMFICSNLRILWEGVKVLNKLRILDVSFSRSLTKTGDLSGLENLEELYMNDCINLIELHDSIGCLKKLVKLNLTSSIPLKMIPWEKIAKLPSLKELFIGLSSFAKGVVREEVNDRVLCSLEECPLEGLEMYQCNISKVSDRAVSLPCLRYLTLYTCNFSIHPDSLLQLDGLREFVLIECEDVDSIPNLPRNITYIKIENCKSLTHLPGNISKLKRLRVLHIDGSLKLGTADPHFLKQVKGLLELIRLTINYCNVSQVPSEIGNLSSLDELNLSNNTFSSLPDSLSNLSKLDFLNIEYCNKLRRLPLLPSNLSYINATGCDALDVRSSSKMRMKVSKESPLSDMSVFRLSPMEIPDWCRYQSTGNIISFVAPWHLDNNMCGIILWVNSPNQLSSPFILKMYNKTQNTCQSYTTELTTDHVSADFSYVMCYPLDDTTISVEPNDSVVLKLPPHGSVSSCGLRLIYPSDVVDGKLVFPTANEPTPHICSGDANESDGDYFSSDDDESE